MVGPDGMAMRGTRRRTSTASERPVIEMVEQPAKVMRIGSMIRQLLEEVRAAPLDEKSRARLKEIHQSSIKELEDGLAPELVEELERLSLPFAEDEAAQRGRAAGRPGPAGRLAGGPVPRHPDHAVRPADGGPGPARADAPGAAAGRDARARQEPERQQQPGRSRARTCSGAGRLRRPATGLARLDAGRSAARPSQAAAWANSASEVPGADLGAPAVAARVAAQEPDVGADPAQAHQRLADPGVVEVALAVDGEAVLAQPVAGRPGLDPGQVDAAHRELGEDLHQRAGVVLAQERHQRGPVRPGRRRAAGRAG